MNLISTPVQVPAGGFLRLSGVDWKTYSRLLFLLGERHHVRFIYDRGELEMMSPTLEHDDDGRFLGDLVFLLTLELGLPLKRGGSVTIRRRRLRRGIEADECFWIANASRMAGRRRLDLRIDPPPDLAIEIDVTNSSLDHLAIYATLRVPEVWRLRNDILTVFVLDSEGNYQTQLTSKSIPQIFPAELVPFLQMAREAGDGNVVIRQFQEWIRQFPKSPPL